jgi:hypothetical protein
MQTGKRRIVHQHLLEAPAQLMGSALHEADTAPRVLAHNLLDKCIDLTVKLLGNFHFSSWLCCRFLLSPS